MGLVIKAQNVWRDVGRFQVAVYPNCHVFILLILENLVIYAQPGRVRLRCLCFIVYRSHHQSEATRSRLNSDEVRLGLYLTSEDII